MGNLKALLLDFWSTGKGLISKIALSLVSAAAAFGAVKELSEGTTGNWGYFFLATAILSWFVLIGLYFKRSKVASIYDSRNRLIREVSRSPYSDRSRLYIGIAIIAFPFIVVLTSYGWWRWQNLPSDKFIILVTKFEEDGQQFGLTDGIYEELTNSTASYPEVQIKQLNEIIKIQKGGKNARQKGVDAKASIVLWGGYIKTPEKVRLKIRVEIL
ncbi:MAG TPA: hypothetical protein VFQ92_14000, partial [Blastocatellia bacterium]|nr:hypothetical protein [Blastocatellia bacterium]